MPKITEVSPQKKNPRRFNIYLDGNFAFGADEDLVVDKRLIVGKELSPVDIEQLIKETEVGKLMEKMYGLFSRRQRSEKEVRSYLKNLSFKRKIKGAEELSSLSVEMLISQMKRKGLIDDQQFALSWTEARSKKKGVRIIKQELFQKGIDREIIDAVISERDRMGEEQTAKNLLDKKMKAWNNLSPLELKKKAYDFLIRRGFEYDLVKTVVEKSIGKRYNSVGEKDLDEDS